MFCFVAVVEIAVLSAYGTSEQFPSTGDSIVFNDVVVEFGTTTGFPNANFTCPSTAMYFVYLHFHFRSDTFRQPCRINFVVGSAILEVRLAMHLHWKYDSSALELHL